MFYAQIALTFLGSLLKFQNLRSNLRPIELELGCQVDSFVLIKV
jgi:hypothetical protein